MQDPTRTGANGGGNAGGHINAAVRTDHDTQNYALRQLLDSVPDRVSVPAQRIQRGQEGGSDDIPSVVTYGWERGNSAQRQHPY